jgi:hypothetical protein
MDSDVRDDFIGPQLLSIIEAVPYSREVSFSPRTLRGHVSVLGDW